MRYNRYYSSSYSFQTHYLEKWHIRKKFVFVRRNRFFYYFTDISLTGVPTEQCPVDCWFLNFSIFCSTGENWKRSNISLHPEKLLQQPSICLFLQIRTYYSVLSSPTTSICSHQFCNIWEKQQILWWHAFGCWHRQILLPKVAYFKFLHIYEDWYLKFKDCNIYPLGRKLEQLEISKLFQILEVVATNQFFLVNNHIVLCWVKYSWFEQRKNNHGWRKQNLDIVNNQQAFWVCCWFLNFDETKKIFLE